MIHTRIAPPSAPIFSLCLGQLKRFRPNPIPPTIRGSPLVYKRENGTRNGIPIITLLPQFHAQGGGDVTSTYDLSVAGQMRQVNHTNCKQCSSNKTLAKVRLVRFLEQSDGPCPSGKCHAHGQPAQGFPPSKDNPCPAQCRWRENERQRKDSH